MIGNSSRMYKYHQNRRTLLTKSGNNITWRITLLLATIIIPIIGYVIYLKFKTHSYKVSTSIPIIGILSKPLCEEKYNVKTDRSQGIETKYVRWIEGGGGKAIYIDYNSTEEELKHIFNQINGLMLMGGAAKLVEYNKTSGRNELTFYAKKAKYMIDLAKEAYNNGDYFPIWGICLGFEIIMLSVAEDYNIMKTGCNCFKYNDILNFTHQAYSSRMLSLLTRKQLYELETNPITYNSHNDFFTTEDFYKNRNLVSELKVISTSTNQNHTISFISAIEGIKYPLYGIQFHSEKSVYDYNANHPSVHSKTSIIIMQTFPIFFINEAKKSKHIFKENEDSYSLYNAEIGFDTNVGVGAVYLFQ